MKTTILRKVVRDNLEWHSERILVDEIKGLMFLEAFKLVPGSREVFGL
jgi:hypothetical protein